MADYTVLGIDPSIAATGLVLLKATGEKQPQVLLAEEVKPAEAAGFARIRAIAFSVMSIIHTHQPNAIVVEGYSLNLKNAASVVPLVELGGVLRLMLHLDGLCWYDPRANQLKQFVTGHGGAPKSHLMMHVLKRWGYTSATDNIADAYGLACIGLAQANRLPGLTTPMRALAGSLILRSN
ncbi:crossover junction endodeoxyribonuclease RuvC [Sinorhizobium fredii]|uniref:crossover junction endodeoxyribonuclease RuvC n=1 Tax=Rhizobium fredii TaxID=380 RepID=UPI0030B77046